MTQTPLQHEAEQAQYALRSSFFYRAHFQWLHLVELVEDVASVRVSWHKRLDLGIPNAAWQTVRKRKIAPVSVFCHPDLIRRRPALISYYRCLALLPQKGLQRLASGTKTLEEGRSSSAMVQRRNHLSKL